MAAVLPRRASPWLRLGPGRTDATARPVLGALGLFGDRPGALDANDPALPPRLQHVASVAIVNEKSAANRDVINDQLQHALNSRIVLEQAKGVLASVGKLDMNTAFTVLRSYARDRGAKVSRGLGLCDQWASPPADAAGGQFDLVATTSIDTKQSTPRCPLAPMPEHILPALIGRVGDAAHRPLVPRVLSRFTVRSLR